MATITVVRRLCRLRAETAAMRAQVALTPTLLGDAEPAKRPLLRRALLSRG